MNKFLLISIILVCLSSGCTEPKKQLIVGISPWPGYEAIPLGVENGLFEPLDVKVVRFATPTESFKALRNGVIDIAAFTIDEVFRFANTKNKPKVFLVMDVSNGGDAVVAKKNIHSLADLKGKRIVAEASALGDYMLHRLFDFSPELTIEDITLSSTDIGEQVELFVSGKVDAAITYEPFKSQMLKAGGHVIFDSSQIPNEIVDILVSNQQTIAKKESSFQLFVTGWFRTLEHISKNYNVAMQQMARYEDIDVKSFQQSYEQLIIPNHQQNKTMFSNSEQSLLKPLQRLSNLMLKKGSLDKQIDLKEVLEPKFVMEYQRATVD